MMIRNPTREEIERLEEASEKDPNNLSNMGVSTHWVKGKGTFYYRLVCEFVPEDTFNESCANNGGENVNS